MKNNQRAMIAVAGVFTLLAAASFAPLHGQPSGKDDAALEVAEHLDSIVQPRFLKDAGVFGAGRVVAVFGHNKVAQFKAIDAEEAQVLSKANAYDRDYLISFLHMTHVPGKCAHQGDQKPVKANPRTYLTPLAVRDVENVMVGSSSDTLAQADELQKVVLGYLPRLRAGAKAQSSFGKRLVVMRPVRASQPSCISCHSGAKQGDTLGVMVYAVDKAANRTAK